jgi:hypothetical protein
MPFSIRPCRRFLVQCSVSYNAAPFKGQGTVWNLSLPGVRLSDDFPLRPDSMSNFLKKEHMLWAGSQLTAL